MFQGYKAGGKGFNNRPKAVHGNAMIEYSIPLGLLAVSALATVQIFTAPMPEMLAGDLNGNLVGNGVNVEPLGSNPQISVASAIAAVGGSTPSTQVLNLNNGTTLVMPTPPQNLAGLIETSGAAGSTSALLGNLDQLIQDMVTSGEIDATEANALKALANKGHQIAEVESIIESLVANSATTADFLNTPITYNGKTYANPAEFTNAHIGFSDSLSNVNNLLDPNNMNAAWDPHERKFISEFVDLYQQAESSGALSSPAAQQIVNQLSSQISFISAAVENSVFTITDHGGSIDNFHGHVEWLTQNSNNASITTNQNSNNICQVGSGGQPVSGNNCP